jgi:SAM-dependent methyltransferase
MPVDAEQYDSIGARYEQIKHIPIGLVEQATVLSAMPDLAGLSVLDVACGTGFYTRQWRRAGARRVVGVDGSREMVAVARAFEERDPLGISYELHNALSMPTLGTFDVVTAIWLLDYAEGVEQADTMIAGLAANLADDGRLRALVANPDADWDAFTPDAGYGLTTHKLGEPENGRQHVRIEVQTETPLQFEAFSWPPGFVEDAFARAGFTTVTRHPAMLSPDARAERGESFWAPILATPTFAVYTVRR